MKFSVSDANKCQFVELSILFYMVQIIVVATVLTVILKTFWGQHFF